MGNVDFSNLIDSAARIQADWEELGLSFCFIGGFALQYWGEPRMTGDIDATVKTGFGNESAIIDKVIRTLSPRISDAANFARLHRVLLVEDSHGVPFNVSLSGLPFETRMIDRSQTVDYAPDRSVRICVASDLVILKAFAGRQQDWEDIRGILIRSPQLLDWKMIESELRVLSELKEEPAIMLQLRELKNRLS